MKKENKELNLEDRLIEFAVRIIHVAESLPKTKADDTGFPVIHDVDMLE